MELPRPSMADVTNDYLYLSDKTQNVEELKMSLLYATILDLNSANLAAGEELRKRDEEISHLKEMLNRALNERDDALAQCLLQKQLILQSTQNQKAQPPPPAVASFVPPTNAAITATLEEEEGKSVRKRSNNSHGNNEHCNGSDSEESAVSYETVLEPIKPLPEKGRLLEAVIEAGPLLQTLILAGPLPQWRHPPPASKAFEIPLVLGIESPPRLPEIDYDCDYTVIRPFTLRKETGTVFSSI